MSTRALTTLIAAVLACGATAPAALAQDPGDDTPLEELLPVGDDPSAVEVEVEEEDDPCAVTEEEDAELRSEDEQADDPAAEVQDDPADEDEGEDDEDVTCDEEDEAEDVLKPGTTPLVSYRTLLRSGTLDGGAVRMSGPGVVTETLTLGTGKASAARAKAPKADRTLGSARKTVRRAGTVRLTVRLTKAGKAALRKAGAKARLTLTVTRTPRGRKAQVTTHRVRLR